MKNTGNCQEKASQEKTLTFKPPQNISFIYFEPKFSNAAALIRLHHIWSSLLPNRSVSMESPGEERGACFRSIFDWLLWLLPTVLLISSLIASLRSVVKLVGQQAFTLICTHKQKKKAHKNTSVSCVVLVCMVKSVGQLHCCAFIMQLKLHKTVSHFLPLPICVCVFLPLCVITSPSALLGECNQGNKKKREKQKKRRKPVNSHSKWRESECCVINSWKVKVLLHEKLTLFFYPDSCHSCFLFHFFRLFSQSLPSPRFIHTTLPLTRHFL